MSAGNNVTTGTCSAMVMYAEQRSDASTRIITYFRENEDGVAAGALVTGSGSYLTLSDSSFCGIGAIVEAITVPETQQITSASQWDAAVANSIHPPLRFYTDADTSPALVIHGSDSDASYPLTMACQGCGAVMPYPPAAPPFPRAETSDGGSDSTLTVVIAAAAAGVVVLAVLAAAYVLRAKKVRASAPVMGVPVAEGIAVIAVPVAAGRSTAVVPTVHDA